MQIRSVGIHLGKTTFHLVALSAAGKVLLRKKFTQKQLISTQVWPRYRVTRGSRPAYDVLRSAPAKGWC
jgi:hypothetical protein